LGSSGPRTRSVASKEKVDPADGTVERYVAGEHMDSDNLKLSRWGDVGDTDLGPAFHRRFRPGQVLYGSRRTYLRKVAVAEFDGVCANTTFVVGPTDPEALLPEFLPFIMSSEPFHAFAIAESKGSVNPYLNWGELADYEFDLPSRADQERLADLLWALELHRRAVPAKALNEVERIMLQRLLSIDDPRLSITSMGAVLLGRQRAPQYATGDHMLPYLRVANVGDNVLRLEDVKAMNFTPEEQDRYLLQPNDIVVSEGQSRELVGQSALIDALPHPTCYQNTLIRFRPDPHKVIPRYAQALFRACLAAGVFADLATQTTSIAHLGVQRFAQLELPWPSISEQQRLLSRLDAVSEAVGSVRAEKDALVALHSSMLADIFGGV
jgi:type I restriction enzyme, S subunit